MMKYIRLVVIIFITLLLLSFFGCGQSSFTNEVPEEDLIITYGRGCTSYKYSGKAKIVSDTSIDSFSILENNKDYYWKNILIGSLEKFAHYESELIMVFDELYYVFELEDYQVPEKSYDNLNYNLSQYSQEEFICKYPNYEAFNWRE